MKEKYSWIGTDKDTHPEALLPDGTRALKPGAVLEIRNGRIVADVNGAFHAITPLKGTATINTSGFPTGTNTLVGSVEDKQNNRLILFLKNSNGSNRIYSLNLETNALSTITTSDTFDFDSKITSINIIENNLTWTVSTGEQRHIDLDNIPNTITVKNTSLYKAAGLEEVTVAKAKDTTILVNKTAGNSFQFTYRLVYNNDAVSLLAPYSTSYWTNPKPDIYTSADNYFTVRAAVPVELRDIAKRIEYFTKINGAPEWYFIGSKDSPTDAGSNQITFTNNYLGFALSQNEQRPNEFIPKSDVQAVFRDRIFTTVKSEGLDVGDGSWSMTIARQSLAQRAGLQWKGYGVYSIGIIFRDDYGRKTLAKKGGDYQGFVAMETGSKTDINDNRNYPAVTITGTPPSWAKTWSFCITADRHYSTFCQFPGNVLFYDFDLADLPVGESIKAYHIVSKGYVYDSRKPSEDWFGLLHIQTPKNLPFTPEVGMYVRAVSIGGGDTVERIRKVDGDRIVVGNFDGIFWGSRTGVEFFEIYSLVEAAGDDIFYESEVYDASLGFSGTYYPEGDTHVVTSDAQTVYRYDGLAITDSTGEYDYGQLDYGANLIGATSSFKIESKTPLFALTTQKAESRVFDLSPGGYGWVTQQGGSTYTLDYSKIITNNGSPFIEQKENPITTEPTTIIFSDTFVQDSAVNGLHNFSSDNLYPLPNDLTPITKLYPIGDNTLLAIHEREVTSLSIGEGHIKTGADSIISKTVGVIGDDRNLLGGYGSVHATSVAGVNGLCFFFDVNKKCVVRYMNNGLFPVSDYGMKSHFILKAEQYYGQEVLGWIDRQNDEYVIHFPAISGVASETWGFNYKRNVWTARYDLTVDHAASALDTFFSGSGNGLYRHNANSNWNQVQGNDLEFSLKFYMNPEVTKTKRLLNLHLHEEGFMSETSNFKIVEIYSPHDQETYLRAPMFDQKEFTQYAPVLRDINSTVDAGKLAIRHGREMRDKYFEVWIKTDNLTNWKLYGVTAVFAESRYGN